MIFGGLSTFLKNGSTKLMTVDAFLAIGSLWSYKLSGGKMTDSSLLCASFCFSNISSLNKSKQPLLHLLMSLGYPAGG